MLTAKSNSGQNILMSACEGGNKLIVQKCINSCMNPNEKDRLGKSVMEYATQAE